MAANAISSKSPPRTRRMSLASNSSGRLSGASLTPAAAGSSIDSTNPHSQSRPRSESFRHTALMQSNLSTGREENGGVVRMQQHRPAAADLDGSRHFSARRESRWECEQCGKVFTRRGHLKRHEENHVESRKYHCDFCNKSFARNDVMLRHRSVHQAGSRISDNSRSEAALKRARRACRQCSSVKMKCDGGQPCGRCRQKADGGLRCSYRTTTSFSTRDFVKATGYAAPVQHPSGGSLPHLVSPQVHRGYHDPSTSYTGTSSPMRTYTERRMFSLPHPQQNRYPYDNSGSLGDSASTLASCAQSISAPSPSISQLPSVSHHHAMASTSTEETFPMNNFESPGLGHVGDDSFLEPWSSDGVFDWLFAAQQISLPWQAGELPAMSETQHANETLVPQQQQSPHLSHVYPALEGGTHSSNVPPLIAAAAAAATQGEVTIRTARHSPQDATTWPNGSSVPPTLERTDVVPVILSLPTRETQALEDTCHVKPLESVALEGLLRLPRLAELHPQQVEATETSLHATPSHTLNLFLQLYFEHFDRICPILHRPTFDPNTCNSMLLGAVCAIGATYSRIPNASDFAGMLITVVNRAIFARLPHDSHIFRNVAVFQALLLNFNFFRSSGRQRMLELAEAARSPLTTMTRKSRLFERSRQPANRHSNTSSSAPASPTQPETGAWMDWIEEETGRRTAWYYFVADLELSAIWKLPPSFALNELKAELPQDGVFWQCPTASMWRRMRPAMTGHPVYLSQLHDVLRLRSCSKPSTVAHKLEETIGPSSAQRMILAYSLVSLGISLHSLESTCLSAAIATAAEEFTGVCKALISATSTSQQHSQLRRVGITGASNDSILPLTPELATAELLLRFVLLRQCLDISDLQLLAGRSGRREDMARSLQHIRGHLVREPHKLWYALIHAGRIIYLCTCHAIDSMYDGCFLFYAATTLFVCAKVWPDFAGTMAEGDTSDNLAKPKKSMTVQVDNEQALSLEEKDWLAWTNAAVAHVSDPAMPDTSHNHVNNNKSHAMGASTSQYDRNQHQHQPQYSHSSHQAPHLAQHHRDDDSQHFDRGPHGNNEASASPSISPFASVLSTPSPGMTSAAFLIASVTPTLTGIGDITRPGVPAGILKHFADHLLSRPARTTWPIARLLGRIMGEMAAVFAS